MSGPSSRTRRNYSAVKVKPWLKNAVNRRSNSPVEGGQAAERRAEQADPGLLEHQIRRQLAETGREPRREQASRLADRAAERDQIVFSHPIALDADARLGLGHHIAAVVAGLHGPAPDVQFAVIVSEHLLELDRAVQGVEGAFGGDAAAADDPIEGIAGDTGSLGAAEEEDVRLEGQGSRRPGRRLGPLAGPRRDLSKYGFDRSRHASPRHELVAPDGSRSASKNARNA